MKYINKRMLLVINKLVTEISGGMSASSSNLRQGAGLGFVERIFTNEFFGEKLYPDIYHQAAAYMFHIIKDHVFIDGNKRVGLATAITFLEYNGIHFAPLDEDSVFSFVIEIASGENDAEVVIPRIARWLKELSFS